MDKTEILKRYFGHDTFRPGQSEIINALLNKRDVLAVMPTGAGKSICYQVPGMLLDGITIVISPLISLMKDQVNALNAAGIPAAYLNSTLTQSQLERATAFALQGKYKFIYVAPERLSAPSFIRFSQQAHISLIAVDEAHCVSQWGQDFRPSYLKINDYVALLPERPPVGAFTATATERVSEDIIRLLELSDPQRVTTGFDRPNLFYEIVNAKKRNDTILRLVQERENDSGIIYCSSRKQVEELTNKLRMNGIPATRYHAGLSDEERKINQEDFQFDRTRVMVATNAFGMGIDKSNVRFVFHAQMPRSIEAYYQEAGRAGRDGAPAECILLYNRQDIIISRYLIENTVTNETLSEEERQTVRKQDYYRLNRMIDLCENNTCIRAGLLKYFGQRTSDQPCGGCSRCAGSRVSEIVDRPLKAKVKEVRPLPEPIEDIDQSSFDDLIVRLKACRIKLAGREHMPAYIVCDDKTLREIARVRPRNLQAFSGIKGIGEIKVQKYGQAFIDAIEEWSRIHPEATINTESDEKVIPEQKDPLRPMTGSERDLLERCLKAELTVEQIAVFMDQPVTVISNWLKSVK